MAEAMTITPQTKIADDFFQNIVVYRDKKKPFSFKKGSKASKVRTILFSKGTNARIRNFTSRLIAAWEEKNIEKTEKKMTKTIEKAMEKMAPEGEIVELDPFYVMSTIKKLDRMGAVLAKKTGNKIYLENKEILDAEIKAGKKDKMFGGYRIGRALKVKMNQLRNLSSWMDATNKLEPVEVTETKEEVEEKPSAVLNERMQELDQFLNHSMDKLTKPAELPKLDLQTNEANEETFELPPEPNFEPEDKEELQKERQEIQEAIAAKKRKENTMAEEKKLDPLNPPVFNQQANTVKTEKQATKDVPTIALPEDVEALKKQVGATIKNIQAQTDRIAEVDKKDAEVSQSINNLDRDIKQEEARRDSAKQKINYYRELVETRWRVLNQQSDDLDRSYSSKTRALEEKQAKEKDMTKQKGEIAEEAGKLELVAKGYEDVATEMQNVSAQVQQTTGKQPGNAEEDVKTYSYGRTV